MSKFLSIKIEPKNSELSGIVEVDITVQAFELSDHESFADSLYKEIGTQNFDVKQIQFGEQLFDVWHDDYYNPQQFDKQFGLAFDVGDGNFMPIFGSIVIAGCDEDGGPISSPITAEMFAVFINDGKVRFITTKEVEADFSVVDPEPEHLNGGKETSMLYPQQSSSLH